MDKLNKEEKELLDNIKTNITLLRKVNGISMRDTAESLGVKENTYRVWEDPDKSSPKPHYIYKIAKAYGVTTDFMYSNNLSDVDGAEAFNISDSELDDIKKAYGDKYLSELSNSEKVIIMQLRQLNKEDKKKALEALSKALDEIYNQ
ncbi:MAG: helix-turn-helix transcriptional regulator [Eubacterium sp.]|nr:helix-turn-helix transcriptional regulator [Eubacterium sp.]